MDISTCPLSRMPAAPCMTSTMNYDQYYELFCITYQGGDHPIECVSIGSMAWHLYHDLGSGVNKQVMPRPPPNYRQNDALSNSLERETCHHAR